MSNQNISLLKTRLHRPLVSAGYIHRPRLIERLEQYQSRSAVLVSAPAGYGKSSLISSWLEDCKRPSFRVSLDENDNDLHQFLNYFVAAVSTLFPSEMHQSQAMVAAPILPPMSALTATLINNLEKIEQDFIVVLDDIHCIQNQRVHELLKLMLRELPRCLQLVLVGRRDPLLPLASLRAGGRLTELRMRDLRFTADEAEHYLSAELGQKIDAAAITSLVEKTEGWVTGLHLSVLAMRGREDAGNKLLELEAGTRYTAEYLLEEVLERMPASIREMLPAEIKQSRPRLLLTQAIVLDSRYRLAEIPAVVESARILMETGTVDTLNHDEPEQNGLDQVELDYLQGYLSFWQGDGYSSQLYLERALRAGPGKPTQNAYVERFNRTVRHEWLDLHSFNSIEHAQLLATQWLWTYNNERPHTAIGGIPPRRLLEAA